MRRVFVTGAALCAAMMLSGQEAKAQCFYPGGYQVQSIGFGVPAVGVSYNSFNVYPRRTVSVGFGYPTYNPYFYRRPVYYAPPIIHTRRVGVPVYRHWRW